jgi:hypothetical protein
MKSKLSVLLVLVMFALCLPRAAVVHAVSVAGVSPCVAGRTAAPFGFWTWPANSRVTVYLREPDFSATDVAAVRVSVQNWDDSAAENGSHVHFSVQGLTSETKTGKGDMTLVRGAIYDQKLKHLALLEAHSLQVDTLIDYAVVIVDPSVRNPGMLTSVMAHEIGHSLGLLDCYQCNGKSTAMGLMKTAQQSNSIEGPTACDKEVVVTAYRQLFARAGRTASGPGFKKPVMDQGEESEADDTPVVDRP